MKRYVKSPILAVDKSSRDATRNLIRVSRSSNVWAYGFQGDNQDPRVGTLYIQFKGNNGGPGDIYAYYDVPSSLYRKWITAPSKGHFFWANIRNNFMYSKLTGDKRGKLRNAVR